MEVATARTSRDQGLIAWIEVGVLGAVLVASGIFLVPAHWTSLWSDAEFTGWSAPLALRLAAGQKLYATGGHIPFTPLSVLVPFWLFGSGSTWIDESLLNFLCQSLVVAFLYLGLSRYLLRPIPFLAALAAIPIYLQLPKTMLYDGMAQASAAAAIVGGAIVVERGSRRALVGLALATAVCFMTKQSTGAGVFVGAILAIAALLPDRFVVRGRLCVYYGTLTVTFIVLMVMAFSAWISPEGYVSDVLLNGSEPKGGNAALLAGLLGFVGQVGQRAAAPFLCIGLGAAAGSGIALEIAPFTRGKLILGCGIGAAVVGFALCFLPWDPKTLPWPAQSPFLGLLSTEVSVAGFAVGLWLCILAALGRLERAAERGLAALLLIALVTAMFHSMSVAWFRWTYDNNPLTMVAFALALAGVSLLAQRCRGGLVLMILATVGLQVACWSSPVKQIALVRESTVPWEDVAYLRGARLRPSATQLHDALRRIRELAGPTGSVLLLPNDPNVEAWFERPRPKLSSAIVFVDQYWDYFVDEDLDRLKKDPPKVIVIGPRNYWPMFQSAIYGPRHGAKRLIDRVIFELLPGRYEIVPMPILFQGKRDWLDVYVRKS